MVVIHNVGTFFEKILHNDLVLFLVECVGHPCIVYLLKL